MSSNVSTSFTFLKRHALFPELLVNSVSSEGPATRQTGTYRLTVPDSRLKVVQSITFAPAHGERVPNDVSVTVPQLWVKAKAKDRSGRLGYDPGVTNVLGTQAAPINIITTAGLQGYSLETDGSGADYFEGRFSALAGGAMPSGSWYVEAIYQPYMYQFTEREWTALVTMMNLSVKG